MQIYNCISSLDIILFPFHINFYVYLYFNNYQGYFHAVYRELSDRSVESTPESPEIYISSDSDEERQPSKLTDNSSHIVGSMSSRLGNVVQESKSI